MTLLHTIARNKVDQYCYNIKVTMDMKLDTMTNVTKKLTA